MLGRPAPTAHGRRFRSGSPPADFQCRLRPSGQEVQVLPASRPGVDDHLIAALEARTTVSSRRALVSKPKRSSRLGGPFSSRGSIHRDHSAAWTASSDETPCLSALGWTFTQRSGPAQPGSPRTCSCHSSLQLRRGRRAPRRSAGPLRLASVQPPDQDAHDLDASAPRRRIRLRPRRPTSGSVPRSPYAYRITKVWPAQDPAAVLDGRTRRDVTGPCFTVGAQRLLHAGNGLRGVDRHDLAVLDRVEPC